MSDMEKSYEDAISVFKGKTKLSDFLITIPNSLSEDFCKKIIEKYKKHKEDQVNTNTVGGYQPEYQKRKMIEISHLPHWKEEDDFFSKTIGDAIRKSKLFFDGNVMDSGYLLTYQDSEGYYHWHHDGTWVDEWCRYYTFIWYLNTLDDGQTEFLFGDKVYPETGKLLLFPANSMFFHRSVKTKKDKYICTGWLYSKNYNDDGRG